MADDDVVDEVQGVSMMTLTSAARVTETLLRSSQDRALRQAHEQREVSDDARQRYEAQARVAEQTYRRAAELDFVREQTQDVVVKAWHGAQNWKDLEPERFGAYADRINTNIQAQYDIDLEGLVRGGFTREQAVEVAPPVITQARGVAREEWVEAEESVLEAAGATSDEWDSKPARDARDAQLDHPDVNDDVRVAARVVDHQRGTDPALAASAGVNLAAAKTRGASRGSARSRFRDLDR